MLNAKDLPSPDVDNISTGALSHHIEIPATVFNPDAPPDVLISWAYGHLTIIRTLVDLVISDSGEDHPAFELACAVLSLLDPARQALSEAVTVGQQRQACAQAKVDQALRQLARYTGSAQHEGGDHGAA